MPILSVIMSVFNGERYVKDTINSVLNQSFRDFEFIVINDGSTDKAPDIMKKFDDKRLKIIDQKNRGLTKSLNTAIKMSKGKYIGRIDCGDIALKEKFEKQVRFLEEKEVCGVGTWANLIDDEGKKIGELRYPTEHERIKKVILRYNPFVHPSMVFSRKLFDDIGLYDETFRYSQDYDLALRAVGKFRIVNLPELLLNYRISEEAISSRRMKHQEFYALKARLKALSQYGYPKWQSLYLLKPFLSLLTPAALKKPLIRKFQHHA